MPDYQLTISASAERDLRRLDQQVRNRVVKSIERLAANPRPPGCVKLTGSSNDWRVRVGDWRVPYTVDDPREMIDIAAVRHRSDAYR